jgi:hypothetical protein
MIGLNARTAQAIALSVDTASNRELAFQIDLLVPTQLGQFSKEPGER